MAVAMGYKYSVVLTDCFVFSNLNLLSKPKNNHGGFVITLNSDLLCRSDLKQNCSFVSVLQGFPLTPNFQGFSENKSLHLAGWGLFIGID